MKVIIFFLFILMVSTQTCSPKTDLNVNDVALIINYPFEGTIYPKNFRSPIFSWSLREELKSDWNIIIKTFEEEFKFKSKTNTWHIPLNEWDKIRDSSVNKKVVVSISGVTKNNTRLSGRVTFSISPHGVEGNVLYREVPVPQDFALTHLHLLRFNLVSLNNNNKPQTIIQPLDDKIYSCLSCHSLSRNARTLTMISKVAPNDLAILTDIDSKLTILNDRNAIPVQGMRRLFRADAISRGVEPAHGGFTDPIISPDGQTLLMVNNVKWVNYSSNHLIKRPFIINVLESNLGIISREKKAIFHLSGTHERGYVYSTPAWSPDGKYITYAFAKLPPEEVVVEAPQQHYTELDPKRHYFMPEGLEFDLYTIPFNNGNGGEPKPIKATQNNGLFDYFPEYSPDGKWIVYTSSKFGTNIFLNPDSTLYIVSTKNDGVSKKLSSNFKGVMNSWHKFSLDGKWLLFQARPDGINTQMFLTHIDENGDDSPPILIDGLTKNNRYRVNLPIFTNLEFDKVIKFPEHGFAKAGKTPFGLDCTICHIFNPYDD